jgi:hypothetical protein
MDESEMFGDMRAISIMVCAGVPLTATERDLVWRRFTETAIEAEALMGNRRRVQVTIPSPPSAAVATSTVAMLRDGDGVELTVDGQSVKLTEAAASAHDGRGGDEMFTCTTCRGEFPDESRVNGISNTCDCCWQRAHPDLSEGDQSEMFGDMHPFAVMMCAGVALTAAERDLVEACLTEAVHTAQARIMGARRPAQTIPCGAPDECERGY